MTREEAIESLRGILTEAVEFENSVCYVTEEDREPLEMAIKALEQEPCEDAMNRILKRMWNCRGKHTTSIDKVKMEQILRDELPPVNPQTKIGQFAKWVAKEIFDDMWDYNKDAFAEIACRKLAKLGIVRANGDEWELVEPQESEEV